MAEPKPKSVVDSGNLLSPECLSLQEAVKGRYFLERELHEPGPVVVGGRCVDRPWVILQPLEHSAFHEHCCGVLHFMINDFVSFPLIDGQASSERGPDVAVPISFGNGLLHSFRHFWKGVVVVVENLFRFVERDSRNPAHE